MSFSNLNLSNKPKLNLAFLPEQPLYETTERTNWQLLTEPFQISQAQHLQLLHLGELLNTFVQSIDKLYTYSKNLNQSVVPQWVCGLYDQGKPEHLLKFSNMKRFKSHLPLVLRPDLLLRKDGWTLCEIDAVPGGIGFTSALNRLYRKSGFPVIEPSGFGMPGAFLSILKALTPKIKNPTIAIILSDESHQYRQEMRWLVEALRQGTDLEPPYKHIYLVHPKEISLIRDLLVFFDPVSHKEKKIDLIYRFFELFDIPNIPKIDLIQYAIKKGLVACTPPFKSQTEEKMSLALLHHPVLSQFWQAELGSDNFEELKQWVPPSWILDPAPLPSQATIPNLVLAEKAIQDFRQLKTLGQKQRKLIIKPSGFSPLAWGSRGITIGHDHSEKAWAERLEIALNSYKETPHILQRFMLATVQEFERLSVDTGLISRFKGRTRLCPYYFINNNTVTLAGILATICPADKKLIHGMRDAILAPCQLAR